MPNTTWSTTDKSANITLSGGNLTMTNSNGANSGGRAADRQTSGKYYWEVTLTTLGANSSNGAGIAVGTASLNFTGSSAAGACILTRSNGVVFNNGNLLGGWGTLVSGTIICIACDVDNRRLWFRLGAAGNWNLNATYNPAANVGGFDITPIGAIAALYPCYSTGFTSDVYTANFGDTAFSGAVPSGFTSGFPTGSPPLIAAATQIAAEEWLAANAQAQLTQVAVEQWALAGTGTGTQAILTQVALEQWASAGVAAAAAQARAIILA